MSALEHELGYMQEDEAQGEGLLGTLGSLASSLLGEDELAAEDEVGFGESGFGESGFGEHGFGEHGYMEDEAQGEGILGALGSMVSGLFSEDELVAEDEAGFGESEQFFGRIGRLVRRALPSLASVARMAVPMVAGAVGGPLGGILGKAAGQFLGEDELGEYELEDEISQEDELEHEQELSAPMGEHEAMAELMAAVASEAQHETEAEAMAGAAAATVLSPADRRALREVLPYIVRGAAILTRILRRRRSTRIAIRAVPTIVRRTTRTLARRAASGRPVGRRAAARAMAAHTRRVLTNPRSCTVAITRNVRGVRGLRRRRQRVIRG